MDRAQVREAIERHFAGLETFAGDTPEQFREHTKKGAAKWGKVVKDTGAKVD